MYEKKSEGSEKLHTSIKRTYSAYTKKNDCLKFSLERVFRLWLSSNEYYT